MLTSGAHASRCSTRRSTLPPTAPLTINEPSKDAKGKKRAVPDENSEEEAATSASAPVKRSKTGYSLRPRGETNATSTDMPKKTRSAPSFSGCRAPADVS